jgi:hypothetical protein
MNIPGKYSFGHSPERIYSTGEFAALYGVEPRTVFRWVEAGKIKADFVWPARDSRQKGEVSDRYYFTKKTMDEMVKEIEENVARNRRNGRAGKHPYSFHNGS